MVAGEGEGCYHDSWAPLIRNPAHANGDNYATLVLFEESRVMAWKDNVHSPVTFVCLDVSLKPPTVDSLFLRSHLPYIVSVTPDCRTLKESFRLHSLLGTDCWQNWRFDLMHCYSLFLKAICDCFRLVPQTNRLPFGVLFLELLVFQKSVLFHLHFYLSFHQLPS